MTTQDLDRMIERVKAAGQAYSRFTQKQVDYIFREAAMAANSHRIDLAVLAQTETGMGIIEDKVIKNHFASEFIYNKHRDAVTCGIIEEDEGSGIKKIAEPLGVICGVIPTTNPTSTAIFKALLALKTRNAIIFSPHPRAKECTAKAAEIIREAAVSAGAPEDIVACITEPSLELTQGLMQHKETALILATGGPGMVKAAYSSGKPAIGVGPGNTPALIDETADIKMAVNSVILSKTFDHGVICASEQSLIVHKDVLTEVKNELKARGAYLVKKAELPKLRDIILQKEKMVINPKIVGQSAMSIAAMAGIKVPPKTKVLVGEVAEVDVSDPLAHEKLSPILALYPCADFEAGVDMARQLIELGGFGHTSVIYTDPNNDSRIGRFGEVAKTGRILVNMPSSQGAIGDIYNFRLEPSLTLGCGSWGGNSVSENVGVKHLLNIKTLAERRENMLWFRIPNKIFHKYGCLPLALKELEGKKRAFIVTDGYLFEHGYADRVTDVLEELGIESQVFSAVKPDPTLASVYEGAKQIQAFKPDTIIALGGGSPMDAAKIMWLLYEHPDTDFQDMAMRFMDIMKRIYRFPKMGVKADFVAIPTTSGTGSEVTPFAVITDEKTGAKYPIADYELTPTMAILDAELVKNMPASLTAASGIDAVTHSLEAMASVMSSDYTNGIALESLRILFKYLPESYRDGADNAKAKEKVHNAATMAGMAFSNAFLGICHSMAHKLGAAFHLPHGVANAILIPYVIRYNAVDVPTKQAAFPQYEYPQAKARYSRVAAYLGLPGNTDNERLESLIGALDELRAALDLPKTIQDFGVSEKDFLAKVDDLALEAFDDQCTGSNPRYPLIAEMKALYLNAFYGKVTEV